MKTRLYAVCNWNTWLLIPWGKLCFRSDALDEVELSVISEEQVVTVPTVPAAVARGLSPELDINAYVDKEQVEGKIPAGFGVYNHWESHEDLWD